MAGAAENCWGLLVEAEGQVPDCGPPRVEAALSGPHPPVLFRSLPERDPRASEVPDEGVTLTRRH